MGCSTNNKPITRWHGSWACEEQQRRLPMKRYRLWFVNLGFYSQDDYGHLNKALSAAQGKGFEVRIASYDFTTGQALPVRSYSPLSGWTYFDG